MSNKQYLEYLKQTLEAVKVHQQTLEAFMLTFKQNLLDNPYLNNEAVEYNASLLARNQVDTLIQHLNSDLAAPNDDTLLSAGYVREIAETTKLPIYKSWNKKLPGGGSKCIHYTTFLDTLLEMTQSTNADSLIVGPAIIPVLSFTDNFNCEMPSVDVNGPYFTGTVDLGESKQLNIYVDPLMESNQFIIYNSTNKDRLVGEVVSN